MERIVVPVATPRPEDFKLTDSGDDFHIELDRLGTFVAEMLVAAHLFEERAPRIPALRPELHDWFQELHMNKPGPLPAPEIEMNHSSLRDAGRTLPRSLFYSGVTQLVSAYEVYLGSLAREIYRYNNELLAIEEKQLTSAQILALDSTERIVNALVDRAVRKLTALSYPALVDRFNREFRVGIHHGSSPATLFTVHHLIEQRNVIVHNGGHVSDLYLERMSAYEGETILTGHGSVPVSFSAFFDYLFAFSVLGDYIDRKVKGTWATSTS